MPRTLISTVKLGFPIKIISSERFRRASKEGLWIVIGHVLAVLGSLIGVRMVTEFLDPGAYGELALGMTVAALVNQTVLGPLSNGATRFYAPAQEQDDVRSYLSAVRHLAMLATGAVLLMMVLIVGCLLIIGRGDWIAITSAALVFAILTGYSSILNGIQNAARQRGIVALHQGIEPWARYLVAVALMLWFGTSSTVAMTGFAVAVILVLGSQCISIQRSIRGFTTTAVHSREWQQDIWKYSRPISVFGMFTWVQVASDRWALELFATTKDVGLYAVLFQLGYYPLSIATGMAVQFLAPIFYQRAGDASDSVRNSAVNRLSWHLTKLVLVLTGLVFLLSFIVHGQIFRLFAAAEYVNVSYLLPWMLLAGGVFAAGQTIALNLMSQMKTHAMMGAKIVSALLGVTLNFAGAYWFGMTGIIIASLVFSIVYLIWMAMLSKCGDMETCP